MAWFKLGKKEVNLRDDAPAESVEALRSRAKYRLIGSVVLLAAGVIGFPMLFDSKPRTVALDIPIEIPDKNKTKPLVAAPASPAPAAVVEDKVSLSGKEEIVVPAKPLDKDAKVPPAQSSVAQTASKTIATGAVVAAATVAAGAAAKAALDKTTTDKASADKASTDKASKDKAIADKASADRAKATELKAAEAKTAEAKTAEADKARKLAEADKAKAAAEAIRVKALLEGQGGQAKPAAGAAAAGSVSSAANPPGTRYIVQFGSYTEAAKAQESRRKVEKAGLRTYSQIAKTPEGERIRVRVGPFASQAEADKAAAKIKSLDLPAAILTL